MDQQEPFRPAKELAPILGVSKEFLYQEARAGRLPCLRLGARVVFRLSELIEHLRVEPVDEKVSVGR